MLMAAGVAGVVAILPKFAGFGMKKPLVCALVAGLFVLLWLAPGAAVQSPGDGDSAYRVAEGDAEEGLDMVGNAKRLAGFAEQLAGFAEQSADAAWEVAGIAEKLIEKSKTGLGRLMIVKMRVLFEARRGGEVARKAEDSAKRSMEGAADAVEAVTKLADAKAKEVEISSALVALSAGAPEGLQLLFNKRLRPCWFMAASVEGDDLIVPMRIHLRPDGSLPRAPELLVDAAVAEEDSRYYSLAETARQAVLNCAPFDIPEELYVEAFVFNFNPGGKALTAAYVAELEADEQEVRRALATATAAAERAASWAEEAGAAANEVARQLAEEWAERCGRSGDVVERKSVGRVAIGRYGNGSWVQAGCREAG